MQGRTDRRKKETDKENTKPSPFSLPCLKKKERGIESKSGSSRKVISKGGKRLKEESEYEEKDRGKRHFLLYIYY